MQFIAFWRPARNLTPFLRGQPGEAWWSPWYLLVSPTLVQRVGACVCMEGPSVCAHREAREEGAPGPGLAGRKGRPRGWGTWTSVCKEGFRKGVSGQMHSALPSVCTCASAQIQVRAGLGSARPDLRTRVLHLSGRGTEWSQDCSTAKGYPSCNPRVLSCGGWIWPLITLITFD